MATENELNGTLEITVIAADWDYKASKPTAWPVQPRINFIRFKPGSANDIIVVKDGSATGPVICYLKATDTEPRCQYFSGTRHNPFVDFSDCTLNTNHSLVIELWRD